MCMYNLVLITMVLFVAVVLSFLSQQTNILVDELVAINVTINATVLLPANLDRSSPGPLFVRVWLLVLTTPISKQHCLSFLSIEIH